MSLMDRWLPPALASRLKPKTEPAVPTDPGTRAVRSRQGATQRPKKSRTPKAIQAAARIPVKTPVKSPVKPSPAAVVPSPPFGQFRLVALLGSFILAGFGQSQWLRIEDESSIWRGWILFVVAACVFIATLRPWKFEGMTSAPFPPLLEKILLAGVLATAAFFRIHHLDQMPPGIYIDQGSVGSIALRILREHYRPIDVDLFTRNPPFLVYQLAAWFLFFKATAYHFLLFFALFSTVFIFFAYWTFRQMAGVRTALLATFILSVMTWNVNFSRNGFPSIQVPFYMFATMAFLYHGLQTRKRWAFVVAACFFAGGFYTYQAYKIFPALLLLFGWFEWSTHRERIRENARNLAVFVSLTAFLFVPFVVLTLRNPDRILWREHNYNIVNTMKEAKSLKPAKDMLFKTAKMFNREGDSNERHNLPGNRMLDDVTGTLFILGLAYSAYRFRRRKYFFALAGFLVMSLPCLLSEDPAHANRMLGTTPFIALLAALPLSAVWARIRSRWGKVGDIAFALILLEPLFLMTVQNYQVYFVKWANQNNLWTTSVWAGYSVPETRIGQTIAREGNQNVYMLSTRWFNYPTIDFLAFDEKKNLKALIPPEGYAPLQCDASHALFFALMNEQDLMVQFLHDLYPAGTVTREKDLAGNVIANYFSVPLDATQAARGLSGTVDGQAEHWPDFPKGFTPGRRYRFKGCVFIPKSDHYAFSSQGGGSLRLQVAGRPVLPGSSMAFARGFYSFEGEWIPSSTPGILMSPSHGPAIHLDSGYLTTLPLNRGWKATWFKADRETGLPMNVEWCPLVNYTHAEDLNVPGDAPSIRWEGVLRAPVTGQYLFATKRDETAMLKIDGRTVFDWSKDPSASIHLEEGNHRVELHFRMTLCATLSLAWKTPRMNALGLIPLEAMGITREGL